MKNKSIFKDWKCRCSSLGHILTNRPNITKELLSQIEEFQEEKKTGLNTNGNKTKWTTSKQTKLDALIQKRDAKDELPEGAKTHLDNVFRAKFWKRRRLLYNKYLDKGNLCEEDSLGLLSQQDGYFYQKNEEYFENKWICGTPDNIQEFVKDTKTNYDMEAFEYAELTSLYKSQVKGYTWLLLGRLKKWKGELIYCLVNNPWHQLTNERTSLYYKMGTPDDDEPRFIEAKQQLERNHIFDVQKWQETYPNYDFENTDLNFSIPGALRIKRFDVVLNSQDIKFMKSRVVMAREYLMEKERIELEKLNYL